MPVTGKNSTGKVYLIGAGPGDSGLITMRGWEILQKVDVVCYDALVDPLLIVTLPSHIEKVYVGKRAGQHSHDQRQIEEILIAFCTDGKTVARLKGGDPFIFGRGGEEALVLHEKGIAYEIVPGVTAATAATAYFGIPLTQRGIATSALLFTAHGKAGGLPKAESSIQNFGKLKNCTLAGYMGIGRIQQVVDSLILGGMEPETPAAIIERGATQSQRMVRAPLRELPKAATDAEMKPPGLIVVGHVTELHDKLDWYQKGPLHGKRVLVTRPVAQAKEMYTLLKEEGAYVIPAPTIQTFPDYDEVAWKNFEQLSASKLGWIVFTSVNGIRTFMDKLFLSGRDIRYLSKFKLAVLGQGSINALLEYGLQPDFTSSEALGEAMKRELTEDVQAGDWVVRVRGNLAPSRIEDSLTNHCADVLPLQTYRTDPVIPDEGMRKWVLDSPIDIATFTSGSTFNSFLEQWGEDAREILNKATIASIGPATSKVIGQAGYTVDIEANQHDVDGLVAAVLTKFL
ncbi:uroporphyrinogen-III C-methyltransferase [bacterium]|nr:uroporphyrinogen-III C-methyltransferase [bacterium]